MSEELKEDPITYTTTSLTKQIFGTDVPEIRENVAKKTKAAEAAIREATVGRIEKIGASISAAIYDAATGRRRTRSFVETEEDDAEEKVGGEITHHHSMTMAEGLMAKIAGVKNKFGKTTRNVLEDKEMIDFIEKLKNEDN